MPELGHKRTFAPEKVMSAFGGKADVCGALAHVCFGPKADIASLIRLLRQRGRETVRFAPKSGWLSGTTKAAPVTSDNICD